MSEVLAFQPETPSKIEEETREFLALLERIRSQAREPEPAEAE